MVFNGGKGGGQPSSGPSACGSRLCRCFGFVLLVVMGVLLYTCMTLVSKNDALSDRVLTYARELTRVRTKEQGLEKRTAEMRQQTFHCQNQLSERSREFATLKVDTDSFKKQANEFHQKLETMATELKTKEDACAQMDSLCKKQTLQLEDELKRMKVLQEAANAECEKRVNVELARVIRVLRAKYGVEPVTELAKAGVDVARALQFMGGSQSSDSNQLQRSGQEQSQPVPGQEQPKPGQEQPKPGQEQPKPGQEQPVPGQEQPKPGQEQPKPGQEQPKSGEEQPKPGEERPKSGEEQPKSGQQQTNFGQEQPRSGQEQPRSGEGQPVQGQLQFKRPEDIKKDEDQNQQSEREKPNEKNDGRQTQRSSQEQPTADDQTEEERNKSEREDAKSLGQGQGPDQSNRDELQKSRSGREKSREEEKRKQDNAKDGQENSRDDRDRAVTDQEQPKENQANEEEKDAKPGQEDAKAGRKDMKSNQISDRFEANEE